MNDKNTQTINNNDIMTLAEIANYLRLSEKTILRMIKANKIPVTKLANRWRFMRTVIDEWLAPRMRAVSEKNLVGIINVAKHPIPLSQLITPARIILDMKPGSKESILSKLVEPLRRTGILADSEAFTKKLVERENIISTAIGHGVAAPHVRDSKENNVRKLAIVLGICKKGTNFHSLDGHKTYVFGLVCSNSEDVQLRLMAKLSLLLRKPDVIRMLRRAKNKQEVITLLTATDRKIGIRK